MTSREKLLRNPIYWFDHEQNEIFRQVSDYMKKENINRTELAEKLKVHKSHVSQILNGNFNPTLKKLTELFLAVGIVPKIEYNTIEAILIEDAREKDLNEILRNSKPAYKEKTELKKGSSDSAFLEFEETPNLKTHKYVTSFVNLNHAAY